MIAVSYTLKPLYQQHMTKRSKHQNELAADKNKTIRFYKLILFKRAKISEFAVMASAHDSQ